MNRADLRDAAAGGERDKPPGQQEPPTREQCSANATKSAAAGDYDAAIAWCSRGLMILNVSSPVDEQLTCSTPTGAAAVALHLRRAEYALKAKQYDDVLRDVAIVLQGLSTGPARKSYAKATRLQCKVFLAMGRQDDALRGWRAQFSMESSVLDELAFRREFGLKGKKAEDDDARYDAMLQYFYRRDFGNAVSLLNKTLGVAKTGKSKSKDPVLFLLRARCRIELGELDGAVADAERVITLLPTAVEAYRWLCEALIAKKKHGQAAKVCKAGLSVSPDDEALVGLQARLQASKQMFDDQKEKHRQRKTIDSSRFGDIQNLEDQAQEEAAVLIEQAEIEAADPAFEAIRELKRTIKCDPRSSALYCRISRLRFGLQQYEQAQSDAAEAIALSAATVEGYVCSCEALYALRRYAKALRVCEQGLRLVHNEASSELHEWEAKLQAALIDPPPEEQHELPKLGKSRVPKAVAARKQERAQRKVDDAQAQRKKCVEKAAELAADRDFGNAVFWLNKAEGYDAVGRDACAAQMFALRARCRFELKQYEHVAKDAKLAIALAPSDPENYHWLCLALKTRGYKDMAIAACASGLKVCPDHKPLQSLMQRLEQVNTSSK